MPTYVDPVDAAQRRKQLLSNLQRNKNDPLRQASEIELRDLSHRETLQQRQYAIDQGLAQRDLALAQRDEALGQHALEFEANQRRMLAHENSSNAYKQLSIDRETEIDEQGHGLLTSMLKLDGALRRGEITKDDYDDGLLEIGQAFPMAMRHPEAARHFEFAITEADKQNAYNLRREITQAARLGAKYGIDPQFDEETGRPSIELTRQAAMRTDKGKLEVLGNMNREMAEKYGVPTGVSSLFNPIEPHSSDDEGKTINLPFLDKEGVTGKLKVPMPLFDQMKTDFNDRYFSLQPKQSAAAGVAPTGVPPQSAPVAQNPRAILAQRALDDPNASEAHKAAARRILGQ